MKPNLFWLYGLLLSITTALTCLYGYGHLIDHDVVQIIAKAYRYVEFGELTHFGNAASSGSSGHVPGSFSSLITGLPMKVWNSPWAALTAMFVLHLIAWLLLLSTLKPMMGAMGLLTFSVFYLLSPWRASEVFLWNPGHIYLVSALHFFSAFKMSNQRSMGWTTLHGLSLFLGLQVHPSFVILALVSLFLWLRKNITISWWGVLLSTFLGVLSLLPFLLLALNRPDLIPQPGKSDSGYLFFGLINVYPLLKSLWYWVMFGSLIFQTHIFHQLSFDWITNEHAASSVKIIWTIIKYLIGGAGVIASFYFNWAFFKKHWALVKGRNLKDLFFRPQSSLEDIHQFAQPEFFSAGEQGIRWCAQYCGLAILSSMLAVAISPTVPIYWHLLYVFPFALIPLSWGFDQLAQSKTSSGPDQIQKSSSHPKLEAFVQIIAKKTNLILMFIAIYLITFNGLAALGSKKHSIHQNLHDAYFEFCKKNC